MAYLKALQVDQLQLPSAPEYTVMMKRKASYGDRLAAQSAMLKVDTNKIGQNGNTVVTELELRAFVRTLTTSMIISWNLTDEHELPLPVSPESLDLLSPEDGEFLAAEAQKRVGVRNEEANRPLGKRSGSRAAPDQGKS